MKFKSNVDIEAALAVSQNATFAGNVTIGDNSASEIFLAFNSSATDFALGANGGNFMIGTSSDLDSGNLITLSGTNGRLGIGTTGPSAKLDVKGDGADFFLQSADYKIARIQPRGTGADLDRGLFSLFNGNTESVRIDTAGNSWLNGGNVGIGTTAPDSKLSVTSTTLNSEDILYLKSGADNVDDYLGIAWELGVGGNGPHSAIRSFAGPSGSDARLGFLTTSDGGTTLTEGLSIAHNGNVGIGTTSPDAPLTVHSSTDPEIRFGYSSTQDHRIQWDSSKVFIHADPENANANSAIALAVDGGTKLYIPDSGNVGIGTTNPGAKLDIHTATNTNGLLIREDTDDSITHNFYVDSSDNGVGVLYANGQSAKIQLNTAGNSYFNGGAVLINATAVRDASNPAKFSLQGGMSEFDTILSNGYDWANSPVSILERANIGTTSHDNKYSPNLNFHWSGRVSNSLWMGANGHLNWGSYTSAGVPAADGTFNAGSATFAGNVGIGTTSPESKLNIEAAAESAIPALGANTTFLKISNSGGEYGTMIGQLSTGDGYIQSQRFDGGNSVYNLLLQKNGGNVGIGTASPNAKLDVAGNTRLGSGTLHVSTDQTFGTGFTYSFRDAVGILNPNGTSAASATAVMSIGGMSNGYSLVTTGNVGIGTTAPAQKLEVDGNIKIGDSNVMYFGAGNDLQIYHDASHTHMANFTGNLRIRQFADDSDITFESDDGSGGTATYFYLDGSGAITRVSRNLRADDSVALQVGSNGDAGFFHNGTDTSISNDTGDLIIQNNANGKDIVFKSDDSSGGTATYFFLDGGSVATQFSQRALFIDNIAAEFGSSRDLKIYHDGSNSYIKDAGSGGLRIASDLFRVYKADLSGLMINAVPDDRVELYFNDNKKFETTSTGVAVTGKITNLTAGTGNLDAVNVQQLNNATTGTLIYKGTWSAAPTTTSVLDGAVSSAGTIVIDAVNPGISVGATITGTGISGTVTVSNIAADGITIAISSAQTIADGVTLTFTTVGGTPDLSQASRKVTGHYYICETAGAVTPNGAGTTPNEWAVGDWATFSDLTTDAWQKIDNSSVLSGAGTGGKVPVWSGTGTSVTLADAPITVSGNHSSFTGDVLPLVNGGSNLGSNSKQWGSIYAGGIGASTVTLTTIKLNGSFSILNKAQNAYIGFATRNTSGSQTVMDLTNVGSATFAGNITFGDSHTIGDDSDDNLVIASSAGENIIIDSADDIILDAAGNDVLFKDAGTHIGTINMSSSNLTIESSVSDKDIIFKGKDGASAITALTLDMSNGGSATFVDDIDLGGKITQTGTGNNTFGGKVSVGGGDTSTAQVALKGQQSLLSFVRGTSGDAQFFMSSDSSRLYFSHTDIQSTNLILTLNQDKTATFAGGVTIATTNSPGLKISKDRSVDNRFLRLNDTGTSGKDFDIINNGGLLFYNHTDSSDLLTITSSGNATFAGDVTVGDDVFLADGGVINLGTDNDLVLFHDGADAVIRNNTGHVFFDNFASDKDIYFRGKDDTTTITALHLDMSNGGSATFVGAITTPNLYLGGSSVRLSPGTNGEVGINYNTSATGSLVWYGGGTVSKFNVTNAGNATFAGNVTLSSTAPVLYLANTTSSTGKTWYFSSAPNGNAYITQDGVIDALRFNHTTGNAIFGGYVNTSLVYGTTDLNLGYAGGTSGIFIKGSTATAGNVGIGTTAPKSKLQVAGGIQMAGDTAAASADKVGTMRYRTGTEYVEVNGTELVTNGNFAADSNWTKEAGWSIASGKASYDASSATNAIHQSIGLTTGSVYKLSFTVVDYTSGSFKGHLSNGNVTAATDAISANGDYSFNITATGALVLFRNVTSFNGSIDNVSVIEVTAEDASYADMCMQTGSSTYEWVNIVRNTY